MALIGRSRYRGTDTQRLSQLRELGVCAFTSLVYARQTWNGCMAQRLVRSSPPPHLTAYQQQFLPEPGAWI